ncbi:antitoxin Xre/MbcA/ParS toxin-binding domain-containing protein [Pseudomonas alkylphenolica]|uniref:antitoxin Xre/MbcA/ParS toxin-binding domain-containing protein n=1 Tax=Pseudomonas alkylphenolica TaxID=237609 RepID=UPI003B283A5D
MRRRELILAMAEEALGSAKLAKIWFTQPAYGLGQLSPCKLLETHRGYESVRDFLVRLEHGVYT